MAVEQSNDIVISIYCLLSSSSCQVDDGDGKVLCNELQTMMSCGGVVVEYRGGKYWVKESGQTVYYLLRAIEMQPQMNPFDGFL